MNLGEKIKKARHKAKITQNTLAGDKITRNMLSQIENGKAMPSLETLAYIANELNLPIAYFFSDDEDTFYYEKKKVIIDIYTAFKNRAYQYCIKLIERLSQTDDELCFILTASHFELGKQSFFKGALISAKENFDAAEKYSQKTVFNTEHITAIIPMYLAIIKNVQAPLLEFDISEYERGLYDTFDYEFFKYLTLDFDYQYKNPVYKKHLDAKILIKERNYKEALKILEDISNESIKKSYNSFAVFNVYSDIENCYKQLYDFENAYRYASKRLSLLESFKT